MWWKVYCKGCKDEYVVRLNPAYNMEYTCMRLGCKTKLKKVKEVEPEIKERHDPWKQKTQQNEVI